MNDTTDLGPVWPEVHTRVPPLLTAVNEFFWTSGSDGVLRMLACNDCDQLIHPPSPVCPACLSRDVEPRPLSGRATVHTYTVNYQEWVPGQEPFVVAIVALDEDEDVRLTTNIVRCKPEDVQIGMPVEVEMVEWEQFFLPCFRPTGKDSA